MGDNVGREKKASEPTSIQETYLKKTAKRRSGMNVKGETPSQSSHQRTSKKKKKKKKEFLTVHRGGKKHFQQSATQKAAYTRESS